MDAIDSVIDPLRDFAKDSVRLVKRILQSGAPYRDRLRRHGIRRFLRQTDIHPYQQHHRWLSLGFCCYYSEAVFGANLDSQRIA
ncbi:hypothetical protein G4B88_018005 [Cannabis sativa]|uniref:Uncharacterized protein n=1 Tax=Cannabis sativa TaxID=3483 RepID=A0A7J6HJC7_CANSA|nr:hypothetical protein G4B88_018005 [Cannabis sativa]